MSRENFDLGGAHFGGTPGFRERAVAAARRTNAAVYMVSGESVTTRQIAARLGVDETTARKRLKRLAALPGQVTWEALA